MYRKAATFRFDSDGYLPGFSDSVRHLITATAALLHIVAQSRHLYFEGRNESHLILALHYLKGCKSTLPVDGQLT